MKSESLNLLEPSGPVQGWLFYYLYVRMIRTHTENVTTTTTTTTTTTNNNNNNNNIIIIINNNNNNKNNLARLIMNLPHEGLWGVEICLYPLLASSLRNRLGSFTSRQIYLVTHWMGG